MENEVIIDGVNVAECDWLINGKDVFGCNSYLCHCEAIKNCYFKQLIRLKAEIKELYESNDKLQGLYQDEHCDVLKYKQALEKINARILNENADDFY